MKHVIYTRCKYDTTEEVARRLKLSRRFTIPAMADQQDCEPVRWVWLCQPEHEQLIEDAVRSRYDGELRFNIRDKDDNIQTTLDSDDWIAPSWLAHIQSQYQPGTKPYIRYYHPWRYQISTGKWFKPARIASWTSMFYAVYNPTEEFRVYFRRHTQIRTSALLHVAAVPQEGFCALVIHDHNKCTVIKKGDIEIPAPKTFVDSRTTR